MKSILWNIFRLACWLLAWAAIIYAAWLLPRAIAGLIEHGTLHPKFWSRLFATILIALGCVMGVFVMVHVTNVRIFIPLWKRFVEKNRAEKSQRGQQRSFTRA